MISYSLFNSYAVRLPVQYPVTADQQNSIPFSGYVGKLGIILSGIMGQEMRFHPLLA